MADTQIAAIRAKLNFTTAEEFIEAFAPLVSAGGMFLRTRQIKPVGSTVRFDFSLANGERLLFGEGVVRQVKKPTADNPSAPTGMLVKFTKLNRSSKELIRRIVAFKNAGSGGGFEAAPRRGAPPHDPDAFYDDQGDRTMAGMPAMQDEEGELYSGSARAGGDIHTSLANLRALVGRRGEPEAAPSGEPELDEGDDLRAMAAPKYDPPSSDTGIPGAEAPRARRPLFPQRPASAPAPVPAPPSIEASAGLLPQGARVSAVAEPPAEPASRAAAGADLGEFRLGMDEDEIDDVLGNLFGGGAGGGGFDFGGDAFGDGVADAGGFFGGLGGPESEGPARPQPGPGPLSPFEGSGGGFHRPVFETEAHERTPEVSAPRGLAAFAHLTSEEPIHVPSPPPAREEVDVDLDIDVEVEEPMSEAEYTASQTMVPARGVPVVPERAPSGSYGAASGSHGAPSGSYGAASGSYGAPSGSHGASSGSHGAPSGSYGAPSGSYGAASGSHGAPSGSYGAASGSYGAPSGSQPAGAYGELAELPEEEAYMELGAADVEAEPQHDVPPPPPVVSAAVYYAEDDFTSEELALTAGVAGDGAAEEERADDVFEPELAEEEAAPAVEQAPAVVEPEVDEDEYFDPFASSGVDEEEEPSSSVIVEPSAYAEPVSEEYVDLDASDQPEEGLEEPSAFVAPPAEVANAFAIPPAEETSYDRYELASSADEDVLDLGAAEAEEEAAPVELESPEDLHAHFAPAPSAVEAEGYIDLGPAEGEEEEFVPEPVAAIAPAPAFDDEEDVGPRGGGGLGSAVTDNFFGEDEDEAAGEHPVALFGDPEAERVLARMAERREAVEPAPTSVASAPAQEEFAAEVAPDALEGDLAEYEEPAFEEEPEAAELDQEEPFVERSVAIPEHLLVSATDEASGLEAEEEAEVQRLFAERRVATAPPPAAESRPLGRIALRRASAEEVDADRREQTRLRDVPVEAPVSEDQPEPEAFEAPLPEPIPEPVMEAEPEPTVAVTAPAPEPEVHEAIFVPPKEVEGELASLLGDIGGSEISASETELKARGPIHLRFSRPTEEVVKSQEADPSLEDLLSLAKSEIEHAEEHARPMEGDAVLDEVLGEVPPPPPPPPTEDTNPFAVPEVGTKKKKGFFSRLFGGD